MPKGDSVTLEYDTDPKPAEATRKAIFSEAVRNKMWIGAAHISFPGLGYVGARENEFVWIPAEYTTQLSIGSSK
jgi:endo-1,4-beta-D-glucanase Y